MMKKRKYKGDLLGGEEERRETARTKLDRWRCRTRGDNIDGKMENTASGT